MFRIVTCPGVFPEHPLCTGHWVGLRVSLLSKDSQSNSATERKSLANDRLTCLVFSWWKGSSMRWEGGRDSLDGGWEGLSEECVSVLIPEGWYYRFPQKRYSEVLTPKNLRM